MWPHFSPIYIYGVKNISILFFTNSSISKSLFKALKNNVILQIYFFEAYYKAMNVFLHNIQHIQKKSLTFSNLDSKRNYESKYSHPFLKFSHECILDQRFPTRFDVILVENLKDFFDFFVQIQAALVIRGLFYLSYSHLKNDLK